jgi:uncharacterized protein YjbJ (UPF0337 family)
VRASDYRSVKYVDSSRVGAIAGSDPQRSRFIARHTEAVLPQRRALLPQNGVQRAWHVDCSTQCQTSNDVITSTHKERDMNWNIIEGKWDQFQGKVKSQWAKLTDDDVANIGAKREVLTGKIQERYGVLKDEAERQIDEWLARFDGTPISKQQP